MCFPLSTGLGERLLPLYHPSRRSLTKSILEWLDDADVEGLEHRCHTPRYDNKIGVLGGKKGLCLFRLMTPKGVGNEHAASLGDATDS